MPKPGLKLVVKSVTPLVYLIPLAYILWPVLWKPLDYRFYNFFQSKRAVPAWTEVAVVAIDETTRFGQFPKPLHPLSRHVDHHARLVQRLTGAGARAIVLDLQLDEDVLDSPPTALASAMRLNGKVYLVTSLNKVTQTRGHSAPRSPSSALIEAAAGVLVADVRVDPDGTLRRIDPAENVGRLGLQSIAEEFGGRRIQRPVPIEFPSVDNPIPVISYSDVLDSTDAVLPLFENRIVFVGSTLDDSPDYAIAPRLQRSSTDEAAFSIPGVTVLAAIAETMIRGAPMRDARWWSVLLFIVVASLFALIPSVRFRPLQLAVWLYVVLCLSVIAAAGFHVGAGLVFPTGLLCGSLLLVGIDTLIRAYFATDKKLITTLERSKENLETQVRERTHELSETNVELQSTLTKLRDTQAQLIQSEKMASLGHLAAGIAHEINNPAGAVASSADISRRCADKLTGQIEQSQQQPSKDIARTLDILKDTNHAAIEAARRISKVVNSLRNFSRLDEAEIQTVDIHEGIESTLTLLAHELGEDIEVKKTFGNIPPIQCYPAELNQVFMNIIRNGIRAIESKGTLTIKTRALNDRVYIEIADNGRGIPEKDLARVFDPGFAAWDVGVGTGLGLSISHNIVTKHEGIIEVASTPGRGSVFTVILPLRK
jgi:signal transduction histidine kinase